MTEAPAERLAVLHRHRLPGAEEGELHRLAALAADVLDAGIAVIAVLEAERQWPVARVGLRGEAMPWPAVVSGLALAAAPGQVLVVPDAARDPRFAGEAPGEGLPAIRFLAGVPLRPPGGPAFGTLCIADARPRPAGLSEPERRRLLALAALTTDAMELRLQARRAQEAAEAEARLRQAQEAAGVVAFEATSGSSPTHAPLGALRRLLGLSETVPLTLRGEAVSAHPEERPRLEMVASRLAAEGGSLLEEFRVTTRDGATLWAQVQAETQFGAQDDPAAWRLSGLLRDVTERRRADERQLFMTRELDHRAKNALAVVLAALRLTPAADPRSYAVAVEGRVAALARAHTLLTEKRWAGVELRDLVAGELRAFLGPVEAVPPPRAGLDGPPVLLLPQAAQPLSMALHELTTNAVKHGALSVPGGRIAVGWALEPGRTGVRLLWVETGGPPLAGPPSRLRFGSRVMRGTVMDQLGGQLLLRWPQSGLVCEMVLPAGRVLAEPGAAGRLGP
ncbi:HWE histidine kinase domain-containing protein [Roseicella frigidaeris]|nr:HWE histidine kinase domain-containing protein [Roseicella frigidaeris]